MKTFEDLLDKLEEKTMAQIVEGTMVECIENEVYEDDDLYEFLYSIGAEIEDFGAEFALISTSKGNYYEVPYEDRENRFGSDLPNETILHFDIGSIYDVTEDHN